MTVLLAGLQSCREDLIPWHLWIALQKVNPLIDNNAIRLTHTREKLGLKNYVLMLVQIPEEAVNDHLLNIMVSTDNYTA